MNEHILNYQTEASQLKVTTWEKWVDDVENIIQTSLDGDQKKDGYSLDYALEAFKNNVSSKKYANSILKGN